MSTTEEITVEVTEHDPHDGDAVLAVLAAMFQPTAPSSIPAMPTVSATAVTTGAAMCRARSFLLDPRTRLSAPMRSDRTQLVQPVDVDILGPSDAVQQARRALAGVFTVQDLGWVSGEHEFETRLRLT